MADLPSRFENLNLRYTVCDSTTKPNDFVDGYENPMTWVKKFKVRSGQLEKNVLFDNLEMKNVTVDEYGYDKPEYIKWKLFGYNIVICYEYITKGERDKALRVIGDLEIILNSIENNDSFLKSIKNALDHITFSMKGHVFKLCSFETDRLEHFVMVNDMNNVDKAGLYGVQTVFVYEYDLPCAQIAKDCALKAIFLNENEAEWHYLLAKVLTHWQRTCGNFFECSRQEIGAAEKAVELGKNDIYKLHLVHIYQRMSRNSSMVDNEEMKNSILNTALQLLNKVISNSSNDVLLLKSCLLSLSKLSNDKSMTNNSIGEVLETLLNKLKLSNNGYVHGAIGNYYLFNKKDFITANFHLKKAYEAKSFGNSIDYIYTLYRMNPEDTTQVEQLLEEMLKSFPHPVYQEKILSQIISFFIVTKNDFIEALRYVPKLLSLRSVTCIYSLQMHRCKFVIPNKKPFNLIDTLEEKLIAASSDSTLPTEHAIQVTEVLQIFEPYKQFVSGLIKEKPHIFGNNNLKKDVPPKNNKPSNWNNDNKESWSNKNPKQNTAYVKSKEEGNWRTLKPDSVSTPNIFSRNYHKQISDSGMEIKSRFNFQNKF